MGLSKAFCRVESVSKWGCASLDNHVDALFRLKVPAGVDYTADLEKARDLMLETAAATDRIFKNPEPVCLLLSFGDYAVNLELRVWINDPQNSLGPIKSNLLWGIWKLFWDHGIEMRYPQRDVHLKSIPEVRIRTGPEER